MTLSDDSGDRQVPGAIKPGADALSMSVIVPVLNGAETLPWCLAALRNSSFRDFELVVIDDGSTDSTGTLLAEARADVLLRNAAPAGCDAARNQGVQAASGNLLLFLDADVEVAHDTLAKVWSHFHDRGAAAVIGLYSLDHPNDNTASRYKNAWIRWSYLLHGDAIPEVTVNWFFTAIGAVRRDSWELVGGFGSGFHRDTGGGDIDFGRRLHDAGVPVLLDKSLAVVHRRRFTVWSLLVNDFRRARGWATLGLSKAGMTNSARSGLANVSKAFVASVALAGVVALLGVLSLRWPRLLPLAVVAAAAYLAASRAFPVWAARNMSTGFALRCAALQFLDHLACGFGVVSALWSRWADGRRPFH